ncbi:MAG: DUF2637 domain-containing protein [Anaerolineae bacterium]|nr:DUF2637 domain-containing protein [Anaerolineae bacterium]
MQRINHLISLASALLVLFLAGSAFFLSFESLKGLAVQIGVVEQIAWLYPAIVAGGVHPDEGGDAQVYAQPGASGVCVPGRWRPCLRREPITRPQRL